MSFPLGSVVWAKLGNYPHWPGRIAQLNDTPKNVRSQLKAEEGSEIIYFFASKNYAVVSDKSIEKWEDGYETRSKAKKAGKSFPTAIKEAEYWLKHHKLPSDDESDEEEEEEEEQTTPRKKSRKDSGEEDKKKNGEKSKKKDTPRSKSAEKEKKKEKEKRRHTDDPKKEKRRGKDSGSEDEHDRKKRLHRDQNDSPYRRSESKREGSPEKRRKTEEDILSKSETDQNGERKKLGSAQIQKVAGQICKHPVAKYFKYAHEDIGDGTATAKATFSTNRPDIQAEVHPSIASLHYLMDITAYLACLSQLQEMQDAQTMDWKVSILSQIAKGSEVSFQANLLQNQSASVLVVECDAYCKGKKVAKGTAVKNIINLTLPLTNEPQSQGLKKKEDA